MILNESGNTVGTRDPRGIQDDDIFGIRLTGGHKEAVVIPPVISKRAGIRPRPLDT